MSSKNKRLLGYINALSSLIIGEDGRPYINGERILTDEDGNQSTSGDKIFIVDNPSVLLGDEYEDGSVAIAINNYIESSTIPLGDDSVEDTFFTKLSISNTIEHKPLLYRDIIEKAIRDIEYTRIDSYDIVYYSGSGNKYYRKTSDNRYELVTGLSDGETLYGLYYTNDSAIRLPAIEIENKNKNKNNITYCELFISPLIEDGNGNYISNDMNNRIDLPVNSKLSYSDYCIVYTPDDEFIDIINGEEFLIIGILKVVSDRDDNFSILIGNIEEENYTIDTDHDEWIALGINKRQLIELLSQEDEPSNSDIVKLATIIHDYDISSLKISNVELDLKGDTRIFEGVINNVISELDRGIYYKNNGRLTCIGNVGHTEKEEDVVTNVYRNNEYLVIEYANSKDRNINLNYVSSVSISDGNLHVEFCDGHYNDYTIPLSSGSTSNSIVNARIEDNESGGRDLVLEYSNGNTYNIDIGRPSSSGNTIDIDVDDSSNSYTEYTFNSGNKSEVTIRVPNSGLSSVVMNNHYAYSDLYSIVTTNNAHLNITVPKIRHIVFSDNPQSNTTSTVRDSGQKYIGISRYVSVSDIQSLSSSDYTWIRISEDNEVKEYDDTTWEGIHEIVSDGMARYYFDIGDELEVHHSTYGDISVRVIGIDQDEVYDSNGEVAEHSMTVEFIDATATRYMCATYHNGNSNYSSDDYYIKENGYNDYSVSSLRTWLNSTSDNTEYPYNGPIEKYKRIDNIEEMSSIISDGFSRILSPSHDHILSDVDYLDSNLNPVDINVVDPNSNPYELGWSIKKYNHGIRITTDTNPIPGKKYLMVKEEYYYEHTEENGGYSNVEELVLSEIVYGENSVFIGKSWNYEYVPIYYIDNGEYVKIPDGENPRNYTSSDGYYYERYYIENDETHLNGETGFMYGLDPEFISVLGYTKKRCVDFFGSEKYIRDRMFLLSIEEIRSFFGSYVDVKYIDNYEVGCGIYRDGTSDNGYDYYDDRYGYEGEVSRDKVSQASYLLRSPLSFIEEELGSTEIHGRYHPTKIAVVSCYGDIHISGAEPYNSNLFVFPACCII